MVTEYIKRGYRKGYDENGNIVYKVRVEETATSAEELVEEEESTLFEKE